jgi:hypothetical protein
MLKEVIMPNTVAGIAIPDSKIAREATDLVKDVESQLLFDHSLRVFLFGSLRGKKQGLKFDPELLYLGAMFHDMGLTKRYSSSTERFEVDGANTARDFMRDHGFSAADIDLVWDAIALHTTPGIPQHKKPEVALVTAGVEMDVLGLGFSEVSETVRDQVLQAHPRVDFKEGIIRAFADGIKHKPETTFGNVKADVLERMVPGFQRTNFCHLILNSDWPD